MFIIGMKHLNLLRFIRAQPYVLGFHYFYRWDNIA